MTTATEKQAGARLVLPLPQLQKALATVALAVERKTTIPVLGLVRIEQADEHVDFIGTNLDLTARFRAKHGGTAGFDATPLLMPALKLEAFAKLLQGDAVSITATDDRRATLRCGKSVTKLPLQPSANYPKVVLDGGDSGIEISQATAERMLRFSSLAVSNEESRYTLHGSLLEVVGGKMRIVATDGHRLVRYTSPADGVDDGSLLLPAGLLRAIAKTIDADGEAALTLDSDETTIFVNVSGSDHAIALAARKMTGQFPNYKAVIPQSAVATATVDAEAMVCALKRCGAFAEVQSGNVRFTVSPTEISMRSASADAGETEDSIDIRCDQTFKPFSIGFNVDYLLDAFTRLKGEAEIRFSALNGDNAAVIFATPEEGETFEYIVMPQRM